MEFLGKLGIDVKLLVAQIINFGLLLWLLKKFLYQPIIRRIEREEKELNAAQIEKEKLEQEKLAFAKQKEAELKTARQRIRQIVAEAEEIAEKIKERARNEAEKEKEDIVQQMQSRLNELENDKKQK